MKIKKKKTPATLLVACLTTLLLGIISGGCQDSSSGGFIPPAAQTPAPVSPVVTSFTVDNSSQAETHPVVLSWTSTDGTSASIDNGGGTGLPANGSVTLTMGASTVVYTITLTGPGGTATKQVTVNINTAPSITQQPSANPTSLQIGNSVVLTAVGSDPESDTLTGTWIADVANPAVVVVPAQSGNTFTATFTPTIAGTYVFTFDLDDGFGNGHVQHSNPVTVTATVAPPAGPIINAAILDNSPIYNLVSGQVVRFNGDFTGYTASMISITGGRVLNIEATELYCELPRKTLVGNQNVDFVFNNGAVSIIKTVVYGDMTAATYNLLLEYGKTGFFGRLVKASMANGVLGVAVDSLASNGYVYYGMSPGADDQRFWLLAKDGADVRILYFNVVTNTVEHNIQLATAGLAYSVSSHLDGTACSVLWYNGVSSYTAVTVARNTGFADADIPLNVVGKVVSFGNGFTSSATVRIAENAVPDQNVTLFAGGTNGTDKCLVKVRTASQTYEKVAITVVPEKILVTRDPGNHRVRVSIVGNNGAGVKQNQESLLDFSVPVPVFAGAHFLQNEVSPITYVVGGYTTGGDFYLALFVDGSVAYKVHNLSSVSPQTRDFDMGLGFTIDRVISSPGNAWMTIAADNGTNTKVRVIANPDDVDIGGTANNFLDSPLITGQVNALVSVPTHCIVELRDGVGGNKLAALNLTNLTDIQIQNLPTVNAPTAVSSNSHSASTRQAARDK